MLQAPTSQSQINYPLENGEQVEVRFCYVQFDMASVQWPFVFKYFITYTIQCDTLCPQKVFGYILNPGSTQPTIQQGKVGIGAPPCSKPCRCPPASQRLFFWLIMKRDTKTDKHRLHTVCSTHVDVQLPLLRFDFNKLHLIGYLDVACSGGFLSLLGNGFLLG